MSIVQTSDFQSRFHISQNKYEEKDLQAFIDEYEKRYLLDLLGKELYDLFIADLDTNNQPTTQRFIDIYEEIYFEEDHCYEYSMTSRGIPEMLRMFIFFEYTRKQNPKNTISGNVRADNENSSPVPNKGSYMNEQYNEGIMSYLTIARFIRENKDVYPEYKGKLKDLVTSIF